MTLINSARRTVHLDPEFVAGYAERTPPWGFGGMGEVVFLRSYARPVGDRLETWAETLQRAINGAIDIGVPFTEDEAQRLFDHCWNLRASLSGRALWQLGTPLVQQLNGASLCNCFYTDIASIEDFEFVMHHLMLGGGVGFSVERAKIHDLPKVKAGVRIAHERTTDADIIVPDSRHGWERLLHSVLKSYLDTGKSFTYSTILVRDKGAPLKTFGGTASGPGALVDGITDICAVLDRRVGKKLRSVDVLDIVNIIGRLVVSGSSRRSAQIAMGDPDDILYLRAKNWGEGNIPAWRSQSNNSILADWWSHVLPEVWSGYDGSGEPYGFLNRRLAREVGRLGEFRPDPTVEGFNPCAEVALADGESCNLATIFLPNVESYEQFVEISGLLYLVQKQVTRLTYPSDKTTRTVQANSRIGQSVTGVLQASAEQRSWLRPGYEMLDRFDKAYSAEMGWPRSVKLTTIQPSGTLSLLPGVTPGIHAAHAPYYIRRVRFNVDDPLVDALRRRGHRVQSDINLDGTTNPNQLVVDFPCRAPEGAVLLRDMDAVAQLEWVKRMQTDWADNAVSVTVTYRADELEAIQEWLAANYDDCVKSVSFLLHQDHNFPLPPYEECSEAEYHAMVSALDLSVPLQPGTGFDNAFDDCAGGACPIR